MIYITNYVNMITYYPGKKEKTINHEFFETILEDPIFFSCNPNSLLSSHFKMKILSYKIYNFFKKTYDPNSSREKHLLHNWLKFFYNINIIDYTNNLPFLVVRQKRINNRSWESWVFQDNFRRTLFLLVRIQIYFFFISF